MSAGHLNTAAMVSEAAAWMNPEPARFVHDSARVAEVLADWVSAPPVIAEDHAPFIEVASHWAHGGSLGPPP